MYKLKFKVKNNPSYKYLYVFYKELLFLIIDYLTLVLCILFIQSTASYISNLVLLLLIRLLACPF